MKLYRGRRFIRTGVVTVTVNDKPLPPRNDLFDHSPDGFEWGYEGSGPAQLALAILVDHLGDRVPTAVALHQAFKREVVAKLPSDGWDLNSDDIAAVVRRLNAS